MTIIPSSNHRSPFDLARDLFHIDRILVLDIDDVADQHGPFELVDVVVLVVVDQILGVQRQHGVVHLGAYASEDNRGRIDRELGSIERYVGAKRELADRVHALV